jgi:hypothetical protein
MTKFFQLRQDTEEWFSKINRSKSNHIKTNFDLYYFCLMLGLATGNENDPIKRCSQKRDLIDYFASHYKAQQNLIIGLFIKAELANKGISLNDKDATKQMLLKLIDPHSQTNLTDYGMERMNAYSSGGFDYLRQTLGMKPYHLEEFLQSYLQILRDAVDKNEDWMPT